MKIFRISFGVLFIILFICSVNQAELVVIGTATYDSDGNGPLEPVGDFKLIWDDSNNGRSVVWLDYTNEALSWSEQNSWARTLQGKLTLNVDPAYSLVWDNSTLTGGWRLPHTLDGPWTVEEQGFEGDPDQNGIYNYTWGWNLANSALGHLFYVELNNVGMKDTNGNDNISYGFQNTGFFENISNTSNYWTGTEHAATGGDNAWVFSAEYGEKTIQLATSTNNGIALRNALVSFNPERLDEIWTNGPFLSGNNSGWRVRPLVPGGSGIFADDFILNGQTAIREIILPTVHYLRDNDKPTLEYINYWFFEDNDGSIGDVIFQGSDNSLEYKNIGVLGATQTSGAVREYRIELPDIPDLNLAPGHYWIGFQVSAEPETFSSLSGGSNAIGEYTGMMASTNDQLAQTPPYWRLFGSSSQSMGFTLLSDVESGPRTFSFTGKINQIIEGDAGLVIGDDISGYFIVADQANVSSGDGTTYALKHISVNIPGGIGSLLWDVQTGEVSIKNDVPDIDEIRLGSSLSIDGSFQNQVGQVNIVAQDNDATVFSDELLPVYAPPLGTFETLYFELVFTGDATFCLPDLTTNQCVVRAKLDTFSILPLATDTDNDTVANNRDNCPGSPNADQADLDQDTIGDACEVVGDVNGDGSVDLIDVIYGLKILAGETVSPVSNYGGNIIGLDEVLYDLNEISK